jgi:hypothetical protein
MSRYVGNVRRTEYRGDGFHRPPQRDVAGFALHLNPVLPARVRVPQLRLAREFPEHGSDVDLRLHQSEVLVGRWYGRPRGWQEVDNHPDRPLISWVALFVRQLVVEPDHLAGARRAALLAARQPATFRRVEHHVEPVADPIVIAIIDVAVDLRAGFEAYQHRAAELAFQAIGERRQPGHCLRKLGGDPRRAGQMHGSIWNATGLSSRRDPQEDCLRIALTGDLILPARVKQPAARVGTNFVLQG